MSFTTGTLEERQAKLADLLEDESFEGDTTELIGEVAEVRQQISDARERRNMADQLRASLPAQTTPAVVEPPATPEAAPVEVRTVARQFAESARNYAGGKLSQTFNLDTRAVLTIDGAGGTNSAAAFTPLVPQPGVLPVNPDRPLRLADMVNRQRTGTPVIEYVRDTTAKGGGSPASVAEAGTKPETAYTFDLVSDTVRTIAHFTNISRNTASDFDQLMAYIESRLLYGLGYKLDSDILNGSGSGVNLRGILNTSGINVYDPASAGTPYTEARVISIRRGMTPVYDAEYAPTAVVLHPDDWQWVELSRDTTEGFRVSPNVQDAIQPRIWGLPVVQTTAITAGTSLVGDFRMGCTLWDLMESVIYMTDSHASNFTANILTLLAELRAGLAIHRLGAFTKVLLNPGTTGSTL